MTSITQEQLLKEKVQIVKTLPALGDQFPQWLDDLPAADIARGDLEWLLAHTYDGVVWGKRDDAGWRLSSQLDEKWELPPLTVNNLMQVRIFGKKGEIFIWRDGGQLRGRTIFDDLKEPPYCREETQILWGTNGRVEDGFTIMTDGSQRLLHAFPDEVTGAYFDQGQTQRHRPLRLRLRHYITRHEETGLARITMSRLYDLDYEKPKKKEGNNGSQA